METITATSLTGTFDLRNDRGLSMSAVLCAVDEGLTRDAIQCILGKFNIQCLWQPAGSQIEFQAADPELSAALVDASNNPKQVVDLIQYIRVVSDLPILAVIKETRIRNWRTYWRQAPVTL
jgi:DNA-binding response OmpR family regulator